MDKEILVKLAESLSATGYEIEELKKADGLTIDGRPPLELKIKPSYPTAPEGSGQNQPA
jgi:hypothetical protein